MSASTVPTGFLFQYEFPIQRLKKTPAAASSLELTSKERLPDLSELTGQRPFADVQAAWTPEGLGLTFHVRRDFETDDKSGIATDRIRLWIDTRNTKNVHRATRFCHQFVLSPLGTSVRSSKPTAQQVPIANAREEASLCDSDQISLNVSTSDDSYTARCWLSKQILHGFDPDSQPQIGFYYEIEDRICGRQTLLVGHEFPYDFDPSLWQTLRLA